MQTKAPNTPSAASGRVLSVDYLRGLVITLMIFVNDLAESPHAPSWLKHLPEGADDMSVADLVFPAFLFIAGLSIPMALGRVAEQGGARLPALGKVLQRTFALLVFGVIMVAGDAHDPWGAPLWTLSSYVALFLCFCSWGGSSPGAVRGPAPWLRACGFLLLAGLALSHRDAAGAPLVLGPVLGFEDGVWLRPSWWGILGLIGWAYLVSSLVFLWSGRRREALLGGAACLVLMFVAAHSDLVPRLLARPWLEWAQPGIDILRLVFGWVDRHVGLAVPLGTLAALSVLGACLGTTLGGQGAIVEAPARLRWAACFAAGLFIAGLLFDGAYGINKIAATPAFCLYTAALTTLLWLLLHWLVDLKGRRAPLAWLAPAGANPLLAYLLHPFLCMVVEACGPRVEALVFFYRELSAPLTCLGSLLVSLLMVWLTGSLSRSGLRLKV